MSLQLTFLPPPKAAKTVRIEFDGGTPCNIPRLGYGIGYGSYRIDGGRVVRCNHDRPMSANAAEIFTLVCAVDTVTFMHPKRDVALLIVGDSRIALKWVYPRRKRAKGSPEFLEAIEALRSSLSGFAVVNTQWQPREHSVLAFGH